MLYISCITLFAIRQTRQKEKWQTGGFYVVKRKSVGLVKLKVDDFMESDTWIFGRNLLLQSLCKFNNYCTRCMSILISTVVLYYFAYSLVSGLGNSLRIFMFPPCLSALTCASLRSCRFISLCGIVRPERWRKLAFSWAAIADFSSVSNEGCE
jgi:hypothetical protein